MCFKVDGGITVYIEPCGEVLAVDGGFEPLGSPNFDAMLLD